MIDLFVDKMQHACNQLQNPTALQVAALLKSERAVVHGEEELSNDKPIVASKFLIQDTVRTKTSPDGHFESHFVTACPFVESGARRWKFQRGRPSDDLELTG